MPKPAFFFQFNKGPALYSQGKPESYDMKGTKKKLRYYMMKHVTCTLYRTIQTILSACK